MQETLQEVNEKMHCERRLPQYKTSSRSVTLNNQMPVLVNVCTVKYALLNHLVHWVKVIWARDGDFWTTQG